MNFTNRLKLIIFNPKEAWPIFESESITVVGLFKIYILGIVVLPIVTLLFSFALVENNTLPSYIGWMDRLFLGLIFLLPRFLLIFLFVAAVAFGVNAIAPALGGEKSLANAVKLVAYSISAMLLSIALSAIPGLGIIVAAGIVYSLYTLHLGIPTMMKCSESVAFRYTCFVILISFISLALLASIASLMTPSGQQTFELVNGFRGLRIDAGL